MVGVAENDPDASLLQLRDGQSLDRADGAHGHEQGSFRLSTPGLQYSGTGLRTAIRGLQAKLHRRSLGKTAHRFDCTTGRQGVIRPAV